MTKAPHPARGTRQVVGAVTGLAFVGMIAGFQGAAHAAELAQAAKDAAPAPVLVPDRVPNVATPVVDPSAEAATVQTVSQTSNPNSSSTTTVAPPAPQPSQSTSPTPQPSPTTTTGPS